MHFLDTLCMFLGHVVHNCNITSIWMSRWVAPINRGKNLKIRKPQIIRKQICKTTLMPYIERQNPSEKDLTLQKVKNNSCLKATYCKKKFQHLILIKIINELHNESFANFYFFYFQRQDFKCIEWRNIMPRKGRIRTWLISWWIISFIVDIRYDKHRYQNIKLCSVDNGR